MISHIFVALGQWEDSVESNVNAFEVSEQRRETRGLSVDALNYHALHWLQYSYLQLGPLANARRTLDRMGEYVTESGSRRAAWHYAAMRALWNVETGGLDTPPAIARDQLELDGASQDLFAEGFVAVRAGDPEAARAALAALRERLDAEADSEAGCGGGRYSPDGARQDAEVLAGSLEGLIVLGEGDTDRALALLEAATALEAALPMEYGPPDIVKPSHELLGEVLASIGRPGDAEAQFEAALERAPRRTRSLLGLAAAAAATGDVDALASACGELASILAARDPGGPAAEMCAPRGATVAP
jgi:tetratricopeptide (TPR) repeat protein